MGVQETRRSRTAVRSGLAPSAGRGRWTTKRAAPKIRSISISRADDGKRYNLQPASVGGEWRNDIARSRQLYMLYSQCRRWRRNRYGRLHAMKVDLPFRKSRAPNHHHQRACTRSRPPLPFLRYASCNTTWPLASRRSCSTRSWDRSYPVADCYQGAAGAMNSNRRTHRARRCRGNHNPAYVQRSSGALKGLSPTCLAGILLFFLFTQYNRVGTTYDF